METVIFQKKPPDFSPSMAAAACYIVCDLTVLFLQRVPSKLEGGKWGVPEGKLELGETPLDAAIRETFEETGIEMDREALQFIDTLFIRKEKIDFPYYMYHFSPSHFPEVCLNHEHEDYRWISFVDAMQLPLISGGEELLNHFQNFYTENVEK